MEQEQRQIDPPEPTPIVKSTARITRTRSDLPKELPKPESEEEEEGQEQEQSESQPKTKKIHHMTLKAMERKQKLAQMEKAGLIPPQKPVEKPPPKKRGRPKGVKKIEERDEYEVNLNEQSPESRIPTPQKKQIVLRKREHIKKLLQPESQEIVENKQEELNNVEVEIQIPIKKVALPPPIAPIVPSQDLASVVPPPGPKKRGRKKKVQPEISGTAVPATGPAVKVFTIPKAQTYDNYNKFYRMIVQKTKERQEVQAPLIFDKFSDPEGYKKLLNSIKK